MELHELTIQQLSDELATKTVSSREVVEQTLKRIEKYDPVIHGYLEVHSEAALARANQIDQRRSQGDKLGPLAGVPVAIKDNMCTTEGHTSCASKILGNFCAPYDAHVVKALNAADAIILGKTNMDEFAMGTSTENSGFGPTRNPWNTETVPGGSSGGSAAVVAAELAYGALGSDTGGSIRQPAAFCSVVGLKPTYGRVSRYGLVAFGSSLDQIGPLTKDVSDAALLLRTIAEHDKRDSTSVNAEVPDYMAKLNEPIKGLKIGVPKEYFGPGLDDEVAEAIRKALDVYESAGAMIIEISIPRYKYALAAYYLVAPAEASSNLARYDGVRYGYRIKNPKDYVDMYSASRADGFGPEVKRRIMLGTYTLSAGYYDAYYLKALKVRTLIKEDFDKAFENVDCVAGPVTPTPAFKLGEKIDNPLSLYMADIYTVTANLAGVPAISIPCGFSAAGLPIGLQLTTKPFTEDLLLRIARMFESATDHHLPRPKLQA
ncbi:MAG: Asp-tRNA(Asn)/Glu-tRNA(Gln) amidotransferase subunit GatA [Actinobacteria bacterium]|nr:Asp-tRNA(Asn)/Glu-tRNA(Gln) amidotransferase subunit GatA [Actinomycetota bacterium]